MYNHEFFKKPVGKAVSLRPWLDDFGEPKWINLKTIEQDVWEIFDNSQKKSREIDFRKPIYDPVEGHVSLLTDPENEEFLELVQRYCVLLRENQHSMVDAASKQANSTYTFIRILMWMRFNLIYKIEDLTSADFAQFMGDVAFGCPDLLGYSNRFTDYFSSLKLNGEDIPIVYRGKQAGGKGSQYAYVDVATIYNTLGIEMALMRSGWGANIFWSLVKENFGERLFELGVVGVPEIKDKLRPDPLNKATLRGYVGVWQNLYDFSYLLPDKIQFNPCNGRSLSQVAADTLRGASIDIVEGQTATIPDLQAFHLIDRAIRWVLLYSEDLFNIADWLERLLPEGLENLNDDVENSQYYQSRKERLSVYENFTPVYMKEGAPGSPWPFSDNRGEISFQKFFTQFLPVACAIVIAAFVARRCDEVITIRDGQPTEGDPAPAAIEVQDGLPWLWTWIEKTLQNWDKVPCPNIVIKATEVLTRLSASARKITGTRHLFQVKKVGSNKIVEINFNKALKEFANFVEVPPLEDGTYWNFTTHQFRRFFSLLYLYRYEHGKFEVLSHHLRHFDMEMTRQYARELKESDMLKALRKNQNTHLMSEILTGKRKASGPAGQHLEEELKKYVRKILKNTEIIPENMPSRLAIKIAGRVMEKLGVKMIPLSWGYCCAFKNKPEKYTGNCTRKNNSSYGPDLSRAKVAKCYGCGHLYVDQIYKPYWENMLNQYNQIVEARQASIPLLKIAIEMKNVYENGLNTYFSE